MTKVTITLKDEDQHFIETAMKTGRYVTESEAVADAISELRAREELHQARFAELRAKVKVGLDQLARGEGVEWNVADVKAKGRALLASGKKLLPNMARIIQAPEAEADAMKIWAYIAQDNLDAAERLLERFDDLFHALASQPFLGKSVEELASNLRFVPLGSYLIFYQPVKDGIEIVRILHGARDITAEFFRD